MSLFVKEKVFMCLSQLTCHVFLFECTSMCIQLGHWLTIETFLLFQALYPFIMALMQSQAAEFLLRVENENDDSSGNVTV